jgi:phage-related protein
LVSHHIENNRKKDTQSYKNPRVSDIHLAGGYKNRRKLGYNEKGKKTQNQKISLKKYFHIYRLPS